MRWLPPFSVSSASLCSMLLGTGLLVGILGWTGCQPEQPELTSLVLQLNWLHGAEFAGYYAAEEEGFYREAGLEVEIRPGDPRIDVAAKLSDGSCELGVMSFSDAMRAAGGRDIAFLAGMYQIPPNVLMAKAAAGIRHPRDLRGKRVGIKNETWRQIVRSLLRSCDIPPEAIQEVPVSQDMTPFLEDRVDVWTGYVEDEPIQARLAGYELTFIYPADFGLDQYEGIIACTRDTLTRHPERVEAFLRASLEGWQAAIRDPEAAAERVLRRRPDLNLQTQVMAMEAITPLLHSGEAPLGWIDADRWERTSRRQSAQPDAMVAALDSEILRKIYETPGQGSRD